MKYIHKQTEVQAIKFTETVAKNPGTFSQFSIEDRADTPHSWTYWKHEDSLKTPGRFYLRSKEHGTMTVCIGDWVVKELDTGHVTVMSEKRFNHLYRPALIKGPPPIDWAEEIRKAGIDLDKFRKQWNEEQIKIFYETTRGYEQQWEPPKGPTCEGKQGIESPITYTVKGMPVNAPMEWVDMSDLDLAVQSKLHAHMAEEARKLDAEIMSNLPTATRAIMEAEDTTNWTTLDAVKAHNERMMNTTKRIIEEHKKSEKAYLEQAKKLKEQAKRAIERDWADSLDAMMYGPIYNERKYLGKKKGEYHEDVHRIDSINPKTGPTDCCNRGTCEGCHDGES